ncbi:MAG: mechanosensitive ion channel family protein [Candidatus Hydrothermarchaeales archaeon]
MAFNIMEILNYTIGNNYVKDYLLALAVFLLAVIVLKIFKYVIINKLKKISAKTRTELDELLIKIIDKVGWPFYLLLSLYIALQFIQIPNFIETALYYVILVLVTYYVIIGIQDLIDYGTHKIILKRREEEKEVDTSVIDLLSKILKGVLWGVAVIFILSNLGYNVSTLIAGLGIGGIAIAFALQNVLSDIFASFSIYFDKPFKIGDFIIVGDDLGVVKKIGIKTTRLQSLWGQEIVISNRELTSTRINNYKKMEKRRIHFTFGVVYNTSTEKLKKILKIIKEIFDKIELADLDRVHFKEFGNFSLNFEVAYYVDTGDYNKYMDTQQEINFAIKERFEKEGIEFAYPTQTVFVNKVVQ